MVQLVDVTLSCIKSSEAASSLVKQLLNLLANLLEIGDLYSHMYEK